MKRIFDLTLATVAFVLLIIPMLLIFIVILLTSKGSALNWSDRVGKNNKIFKMPKFRSMLISTPTVATHLLENPGSYLSPIGGFLRRSSLDEIQQIFSVFKGDMSFVGPRPALFNQNDLINLRTNKGVNKILPGITGWAQVNGRDNISLNKKIDYDYFYLKNKSFILDCKIIILTFIKVVKKDDIL